MSRLKSNWTRAAFAAAMLMLAGTGVVSYANLQVMIETNQNRHRSDDFLDAADAVQSNLSRASAARRGFVITGDAGYRRRFRDALTALDDALTRLTEMDGDPRQAAGTQELKPLLARRVDLLRDSLEIGAEALRDRDAQIRVTREEQDIGDRIRTLLGDLKAVELRNLAGREAEVNRQARQAVLLSAVGSISALVMLLGSGLLVRQGQAALSESESRNRSIVETAAVGILTVDAGGVVETVNPALERLFGLSAGDLVGRDIRQILPKLAEGPDCGSRETAGRHRDGTEVPVEVSFSERPFGSAGLRTVLIRDIRERRRVEEQNRRLQAELAAAQRLEALGRLAGGVAHDFNSLLTGIIWFADLAAAELPAGGKPAEDVAEIRRAAQRAGGLVRQLLAFARGQNVETEAVDLDRVVSDMAPLLRGIAGDGVGFDLRLGGAGRLRINPGQLEQVLTNLVANAHDAMPDGGRIVLRTGRTEADTGRPMVLLEVSDTGGGMDEAIRSRIFEPFFTTKEAGKGTGLGLAVVHGIVHQAGGRIELDSVPGAGTTFRIYLPADPDGAEPPS